MSETDRLREMIEGARRIVAFTGAGISTESGIPDFRSPGGIWTKYQPIYFDDFMSSEEMRRESWRRKFATDETMQKAEPNAGHRALAKLVEQNAALALAIAEHGYVMENGRVVLEGSAAKLAANSDIKEFYLGLNEGGARKSYRDTKHYKRRKRWLS